MINKLELRQKIRTELATLTPEQTALFDTQITSYFLTSQSLMPQTTIACYMPLKNEVSCRTLLQHLGAQGHTICLPVVTGRNDPMIFRQYRPGDPLERGFMGPLEPNKLAREVIPDVLLIPLLGYSRNGYRLGYGTGFYDRTLESLRQFKSIKAIGLAYSIQEIADFPVEPHDKPLDTIITEKEIIQRP